VKCGGSLESRFLVKQSLHSYRLSREITAGLIIMGPRWAGLCLFSSVRPGPQNEEQAAPGSFQVGSVQKVMRSFLIRENQVVSSF
jgi:hypothetical protein